MFYGGYDFSFPPSFLLSPGRMTGLASLLSGREVRKAVTVRYIGLYPLATIDGGTPRQFVAGRSHANTLIMNRMAWS